MQRKYPSNKADPIQAQIWAKKTSGGDEKPLDEYSTTTPMNDMAALPGQYPMRQYPKSTAYPRYKPSFQQPSFSGEQAPIRNMPFPWHSPVSMPTSSFASHPIASMNVLDSEEVRNKLETITLPDELYNVTKLLRTAGCKGPIFFHGSKLTLYLQQHLQTLYPGYKFLNPNINYSDLYKKADIDLIILPFNDSVRKNFEALGFYKVNCKKNIDLYGYKSAWGHVDLVIQEKGDIKRQLDMDYTPKENELCPDSSVAAILLAVYENNDWKGKTLDPTGLGISDLIPNGQNNGKWQMIGNISERIEKDSSVLLRAIKYFGVYGFEPYPIVSQALYLWKCYPDKLPFEFWQGLGRLILNPVYSEDVTARIINEIIKYNLPQKLFDLPAIFGFSRDINDANILHQILRNAKLNDNRLINMMRDRMATEVNNKIIASKTKMRMLNEKTELTKAQPLVIKNTEIERPKLEINLTALDVIPTTPIPLALNIETKEAAPQKIVQSDNTVEETIALPKNKKKKKKRRGNIPSVDNFYQEEKDEKKIEATVPDIQTIEEAQETTLEQSETNVVEEETPEITAELVKTNKKRKKKKKSEKTAQVAAISNSKNKPPIPCNYHSFFKQASSPSDNPTPLKIISKKEQIKEWETFFSKLTEIKLENGKTVNLLDLNIKFTSSSFSIPNAELETVPELLLHNNEPLKISIVDYLYFMVGCIKDIGVLLGAKFKDAHVTEGKEQIKVFFDCLRNNDCSIIVKNLEIFQKEFEYIKDYLHHLDKDVNAVNCDEDTRSQNLELAKYFRLIPLTEEHFNFFKFYLNLINKLPECQALPANDKNLVLNPFLRDAKKQVCNKRDEEVCFHALRMCALQLFRFLSYYKDKGLMIKHPLLLNAQSTLFREIRRLLMLPNLQDLFNYDDLCKFIYPLIDRFIIQAGGKEFISFPDNRSVLVPEGKLLIPHITIQAMMTNIQAYVDKVSINIEKLSNKIQPYLDKKSANEKAFNEKINSQLTALKSSTLAEDIKGVALLSMLSNIEHPEIGDTAYKFFFYDLNTEPFIAINRCLQSLPPGLTELTQAPEKQEVYSLKM